MVSTESRRARIATFVPAWRLPYRGVAHITIPVRHAGHERRSFLVPDLDEPDFVLAGAKGLHDSVDPVSGHAENNVDAPIADGID